MWDWTVSDLLWFLGYYILEILTKSLGYLLSFLVGSEIEFFFGFNIIKLPNVLVSCLASQISFSHGYLTSCPVQVNFEIHFLVFPFLWDHIPSSVGLPWLVRYSFVISYGFYLFLFKKIFFGIRYFCISGSISHIKKMKIQSKKKVKFL